MSDEECIHGLGFKSACTICNGKDAQIESDSWLMIPAKFNSTCRSCGTDLPVGTCIWWSPDQYGILCLDCK